MGCSRAPQDDKGSCVSLTSAGVASMADLSAATWGGEGSRIDAQGGGDLAEGGGLGVADLVLSAAGLRLDGRLGDALANQQQPPCVLGDVGARGPAAEQVD